MSELLESLECRRLLNASLNDKGTLVIFGGASADDIGVWQPNAATLQVVINGQTSDFATADVDDIYVDAGVGDDLIVIGAHAPNATLIGGRGNDSLSGGDGNDRLYGGEGNDYLFGRAGDDVIDQSASRDGADLMLGGDGKDAIDYSRRRKGIRVGIGVLDDDGEKGEHDDIRADVEIVHGGAGADRLSTTRPDLPVTFYGNAGNDTLIGSDKSDVLVGGRGRDRVWNVDADDVVLTKDGERDIVVGGMGFAPLAKDRIDFVTIEFA